MDMAYIIVENNQASWGEIVPTESWHIPQQNHLLKSFCMDRYEFPNQKGVVPLVKVQWEKARILCQSADKRLCSEAEWEYACRGQKKRLYSYGNKRRVGMCNSDIPRPQEKVLPSPSGSFPECQSPEGVFDLNGNVSEWVEDDWRDFDHNQKRWKSQKEGHKTLRGGTMWSQTHYGQDCTSRHGHHRNTWHNRDDGFRCCFTPTKNINSSIED